MAATARIVRRLTQQDFDRFAAISGDDNPIHVDPDFAGRTRFGTTVAHGMFLYSILESLAASAIGDARVSQTALMFPAPARVGDEIAFEAHRVDGRIDLSAKRLVDGETVCRLTLDVAEQS